MGQDYIGIFSTVNVRAVADGAAVNTAVFVLVLSLTLTSKEVHRFSIGGMSQMLGGGGTRYRVEVNAKHNNSNNNNTKSRRPKSSATSSPRFPCAEKSKHNPAKTFANPNDPAI